MPKTEKFTAIALLNIPQELEPGILYVSQKYAVTAHLCPCGCGDRTIVTLEASWQPKAWTYDEATVTLHPSILNNACPNRAHYWIRDGKVVWA